MCQSQIQLGCSAVLGTDLLGKIHELMKKLSTIKGRAYLHTFTPLEPRLRQDTQWSSTFTMLQRYVRFLPLFALFQSADITRLCILPGTVIVVMTHVSMILRLNRHLWDVDMVQKIIRDKDKAGLLNDDDDVSDEECSSSNALLVLVCMSAFFTI